MKNRKDGGSGHNGWAILVDFEAASFDRLKRPPTKDRHAHVSWPAAHRSMTGALLSRSLSVSLEWVSWLIFIRCSGLHCDHVNLRWIRTSCH